MMTQIQLPDYWLPRPAPPLTPAEEARCDAALTAMLAQGPDAPFAYTLPIPKWQFLCHLTDRRGFMLHGSNDHTLKQLVPRKSSDLHEFGAQQAVYAAGDGIWPLYFAIVDRKQVPTLINACIRIISADGQEIGPLYQFSISRQAAPHKPFVAGMIYVLPAATFTLEPAMHSGELQVRTAQAVSLTAVKPLAKLIVLPEDFPFLAQMRTHDDDRLAEYAAAMRAGAPWPA
jgi:hypothetical protein